MSNVANASANPYYGDNVFRTRAATEALLGKYSWNLPPHRTSLPVLPSSDPLLVDTAKATNSLVQDRNAMHKYRRGRIYWYSRVDAATVSANTNNTGGLDPRYGFQFLWNPDQITTSVAVNMDITPTAADKFVKVVGAFPSAEYLGINIRLDRTNDFFAMKAVNNISNTYANNALSDYQAGGILENAITSAGNSGISRFRTKLNELRKRGTLADVEYLYKAINGPGWTNVATGTDSSDIGFLSPTLLKIDLGPISYIGYVQNLNVTHTAFTPGMIPIRSDVSLQFNLMATAGLSTGGER